MNRPSTAVLESAYDQLFTSSLENLLESALQGRLFHELGDVEGVAGRSMAWKLFLSPHPPLTASLNPHPSPPLDFLCSSRERYVASLKEQRHVPDGSLEEGFQVPYLPAAPKKLDNWNLNHPLSLDSSNPWHAYFSALESRNTIRQDVERTFPEISYFRSVTVQNEMTDILFLHASERENIGYRQGMHELLACIYHAVDFDSVEHSYSQVNPRLHQLCDREYVAADAYALFGAIMQRMESWYEWRAAVPKPVSTTSNLSHDETAASTQVNALNNGQLHLKPYVAPIVLTCASLRDEKLRLVDPHLWEKLREGGVEAQMYGIRWLRLLFTREFTLAESMIIWDGLFASVVDPISTSSSPCSQRGFELALWISVAMLIRIRNNLITGDFNTQLTYLLRYPNPSLLGASQTSNAPALLLRQAQLLSASPTPGTGVSLVMQNRNELGIPVEMPDSSSPTPQRKRTSAVATAPSTLLQGRTGHLHERSRLQDIIANRLMDANETLGIQRSFLNTISELKKNLPDLSQSLIRSRNESSILLVEEPTDETAQDSALPVSDVNTRPPWEPRLRSEMESEISELRVLLKTLGDAVGWAMDVLMLDEEETKQTMEGEESVRQKKREAVECLAYVRDILSRGGKGKIDEGRLINEEEHQRRRRRKKEETGAAGGDIQRSLSIPIVPPLAATSSETPPLNPGNPRSKSTTPISYLTRTPIPLSHPSPVSGAPPSAFSIQPNPGSEPIAHKSKKPIFSREQLPSDPPGGSLPQYPPRKPTDHSISQTSVPNATNVISNSSRADPLGVLH